MSVLIRPRRLAAEPSPPRPTREAALEAVRTLIAWAGDDPDREGLLETPGRVADAFGEWFAGYDGDPVRKLSEHSRMCRATTTW